MLYIYLAMLESHDDQSKMTDLYVTYREHLLNAARDILRNEHDAEDVLHQAFLYIARNFKKIGEVSSHQTRNYLVIIVRGYALNLFGKRNKLVEVPFENLEGIDDSLLVEDPNPELFEFEALHQALKQLPMEQQDILYMMYFEDRKIKEISKSLGLSESAAKKRLQRARLALRKIVLAEGVGAR